MSEQFEARLVECLDALETPQPGAGIEEILARYPDDAPALRRALAVAGALAEFDVQPSAGAEDESRRRLLAAAAAVDRPAPRGRIGMLALRTGAILLVVLAAGAIPVVASANALPGDPLYGLKREVEDVQLQFAFSEAARETLLERYNLLRIQELDDLIDDGRSGQTEFEGRIEEIQPGGLVVGGKTIVVPPELAMIDLPVGMLVEVTVRVEDGQLILVEIEPADPEDGQVLPAPATATPVPGTPPGASRTPEPTREDNSGPGSIEPTDDDDGESSGGEGGGEIEPTEDGEDSGGGDDPTVEPTEDESGDDSGGDDNSGSGGGDDDGGGDDSGGHGGGDDD
jgi:hypothetical protein